MNLPIVNSHDHWSQLEEVWLGDVYPQSWYDHLDSEVRDCFWELTEKTKHDLLIVEKKLQSFGIKVCRPTYDCIDNFLDDNDTLIKPEIAPRDHYITIGNTLFAKYPESWIKKNPWQSHLDRYQSQDEKFVATILQNNLLHINGASTVRVGQDLFMDLGSMDPARKSLLVESFELDFLSFFKEYRVNLLFNGGHLDGCFAVLRPGLILASSYYTEYEKTFPGWTIVNCLNPEFKDHQKDRAGPYQCGKWLLPGPNKKAFNKYVIEHAQNWIGDYTETFFDINCLVVDEKNIILLGEHEKVQRELESYGITTHSVPFRTRTFWDSGMHCLTLDIRRRGVCKNYFPEKTDEKFLINL